MAEAVNSISDLEKELEKNGQVLEGIRVLFLDISSSCTGYAIANLDFKSKSADFQRAGAIWLDPDWSHQEKYSYMFNAIVNYFWVAEAIDYIVVEQYSINPNRMMGVNVVPEMQGAIKTAAWENGVKVSSILPQTWRSQLGIKKDSSGDWKGPTKLKIAQYTQVPIESESNLTRKLRATPSDLYDAMAVGMGWTKKLGFDESKWKFNNIKFNTHVGY